MVRLISKSCFMYFICALLAFVLMKLFLSIKSLDWNIQTSLPPTYSVSLNYQCDMLQRPLCNYSLTTSCCVIVLVDRQGRLGNRMFIFASAMGIALAYSCQLTIDMEILNELNSIFTIDLAQIPELKVLEPVHIGPCTDRKYNYCDYFPIVFEKNRYHVIELTGFWQSYRFFEKYTSQIKGQFVFKDDIKQKIAHFFREEEHKHINRSIDLHGNGTRVKDLKVDDQTLSSTWVGIHVRRGDFLYYRQVSSMNFIVEAMDYFKKKYSNVIFLIASDDKDFCKRTYGNVLNIVITPTSFTAGEDLAALAMCHHMIVTVGTFGWWAGFLTNGEVLHDVRFSKTLTPLDNNCTQNNYLPPSFLFFNKTF